MLQTLVATRKVFNILCGDITYITIGNFLHNFFLTAREDVNCEILNLNMRSPDPEIEGLRKREKTRVLYSQHGTLPTL